MKRILSAFVAAFALSFSMSTLATAPSNAELAKEIERLNQQNNYLQREMAVLNQKVACKENCAPKPCWSFFDFSDPLYLKHKFPYFYDIVTQLSPKSASNVEHCFSGVCVSGLANFDLLMFDRSGNGFRPGSAAGVGVRPLFDIHQTALIGSINNVDLFIDGAVNKWSSLHFDFVYVNSSIQSDSYSYNDKDNNTVYTNGASLKVNQAYLLVADPCVTPFYFQLGRFNNIFGDYEPFPIFQSLTQLISEMRTGGFILGAIFGNGLYGAVSWTMAEQSLRDFDGNTPLFGATPSFFDYTRNPGAKIGFRGCAGSVFLNLNASAVYNIADANYINAAFLFLNKDGKNNKAILEPILRNQFFVLNRAPGLALHADGLYGNFALSADFVSALSNLNTGVENNGHIRAWGINGAVSFCPCGYPTTFTAGYQGSKHSDIFNAINVCLDTTCPLGPFGTFSVGTILPETRYEASVTVGVMQNINLALALINDRDLSVEAGGTGLASDYVKFRVNVNL